MYRKLSLDYFDTEDNLKAWSLSGKFWTCMEHLFSVISKRTYGCLIVMDISRKWYSQKVSVTLNLKICVPCLCSDSLVFLLVKWFSLPLYWLSISLSTKWDSICLYGLFVYVCLESPEGSESRGSSEEEDEWAGVVAAPALPHHPLPHPQQTRKGDLFVPSCHSLHPCSCNAPVLPLEGDMYLSKESQWNLVMAWDNLTL